MSSPNADVYFNIKGNFKLLSNVVSTNLQIDGSLDPVIENDTIEYRFKYAIDNIESIDLNISDIINTPHLDIFEFYIYYRLNEEPQNPKIALRLKDFSSSDILNNGVDKYTNITNQLFQSAGNITLRPISGKLSGCKVFGIMVKRINFDGGTIHVTGSSNGDVNVPITLTITKTGTGTSDVTLSSVGGTFSDYILNFANATPETQTVTVTYTTAGSKVVSMVSSNDLFVVNSLIIEIAEMPNNNIFIQSTTPTMVNGDYWIDADPPSA